MTTVTANIIVTLLIFSLANSASVTTNNGDKAKTKDADVMQKNMNTQMGDDQEDIGVLEKAMTECNETFRTEISYIISLNESGSFPDETDRTPKCFIRCVLEMTGVASEDGQYDPIQTAVVFPEERGGKPMNDLEDMARGCTDRKESCKCERAYQYIKCLMETEIKKYSEKS